MKLFNFLQRTPPLRIHVPHGRAGKVEWYVRVEVQDYNLMFPSKKKAKAYQEILLTSSSPMPSKVQRIELDAETGMHIIYPSTKEKKQ